MTYEKLNSKLFLVSFYNDKHVNSFHTRCWQLTSQEPKREGRWSETRYYGSCTLRSRDRRKETVAETYLSSSAVFLGTTFPFSCKERRGALERHNREQKGFRGAIEASSKTLFQIFAEVVVAEWLARDDLYTRVESDGAVGSIPTDGWRLLSLNVSHSKWRAMLTERPEYYWSLTWARRQFFFFRLFSYHRFHHWHFLCFFHYSSEYRLQDRKRFNFPKGEHLRLLLLVLPLLGILAALRPFSFLHAKWYQRTTAHTN